VSSTEPSTQTPQSFHPRLHIRIVFLDGQEFSGEFSVVSFGNVGWVDLYDVNAPEQTRYIFPIHTIRLIEERACG